MSKVLARRTNKGEEAAASRDNCAVRFATSAKAGRSGERSHASTSESPICSNPNQGRAVLTSKSTEPLLSRSARANSADIADDDLADLLCACSRDAQQRSGALDGAALATSGDTASRTTHARD